MTGLTVVLPAGALLRLSLARPRAGETAGEDEERSSHRDLLEGGLGVRPLSICTSLRVYAQLDVPGSSSAGG